MNATADITADIADTLAHIAECMEIGADCDALRADLEELYEMLAAAKAADAPKVVKAVRKFSGRYIIECNGVEVGSAYRYAVKGAMTAWKVMLTNGQSRTCDTLKGCVAFATKAI